MNNELENDILWALFWITYAALIVFFLVIIVSLLET